MYSYFAFGEVIHSDMRLDYIECRSDARLPFVLCEGEIEARFVGLGEPLHAEPDYPGGPVLLIWGTALEHVLLVEYSGWRVVLDGLKREMIYQKTIEIPEVELRFVCERVLMPLCLLLDPKRTLVALHGGALSVQGSAWILVGESGVGKSTATLEIVCRGGQLLSDDMALVDCDGGCVLPGAPTVRLWRDRLEMAREKSPIPGNEQKHWFRLIDEKGAGKAMPLEGIIFLEVDPEASSAGELSRLKGVEAFVALLSNGFDLEHAPRVMLAARMRRTKHLLEQVPVWRCRYARDPGGEPLQTRGILKLIEGSHP